MRILQVTNFFKPSWESGGPARVAYEISKRLVERGHEVTVYTTDGFKWRLDVETNMPVFVDGIKTYYFRNLYLVRKRVFPTPYYAPVVARKEIMNFDVIHIHEGNTLGYFVHHYAEKFGVPYVHQVHGSLLIRMNRERSIVGKIWDTLVEYRTLHDASKVIALTKTEAEQYKKMNVGGNKIKIVPNGIDLSEYTNLPEGGEFRRKYSISNDEKIVLYVGRMNKTKGIDLLIKAFADVSKKLNDVKLVLVGPDDGYRSALEGQIQMLKVEDNVLFAGFVSDDEKKMAFVDADVFVTPSFSGFPVTFLEACACGTPIITTNKGDKLDWIQDKVGYVVEYDKDQLKKAMVKVLSDEELRRKFGEDGKKLMREKFGWDKIVKQVESVYEELIGDQND
jgi:glycosyltransferase involved in cell wall biosynthesis